LQVLRDTHKLSACKAELLNYSIQWDNSMFQIDLYKTKINMAVVITAQFSCKKVQ